MFNAWRKAWAKEKDAQADISYSEPSGVALGGDNLVLDQPETTEDGANVATASGVLDPVLSTSHPERTTSQMSSSPLASHTAALLTTTLSGPMSGHAESTQLQIDEHPERVLPPPAKRRKLDPFKATTSEPPPKDEARIKFEAAISSNTIVPFSSPAVEAKFLDYLITWSRREQSDSFERNQDRKLTIIVTISNERAQLLHSLVDGIHGIECGCLASEVPEIAESMEIDLPDLQVVDVLIFTVQYFLHVLSRNTLSFSMTSLLIIDGADDARHGHSYAHLMLDFYHASPPSDRPKVTGLMQESPLSPEILFAESTCDASVFGLSNEARSSLRAQISQPEEIVTFYEPSAVKRDTTLCAQLKSIDPDSRVMKQQFAAATATLRDVGPCAADLVWRRYMITLEPEFRAGEPEPTGDEAADEIASDNFRIKAKVRALLKEWTFTMPNLNPSSKSFNVTPKFAKLVQILQCFEAQGEEFRGLILVQRRSTTAAVVDMLRTIGDQLPFLRPQTLVGQETRADVMDGMDRAAQHDLVEEFRSGKINLLVATRVAEDGVEIPTCTVVIRFDLFENHISYAQSRARADQNHGHFILMAEQGNDLHRRVVYGVARLDPAMRNWVHAVANTPGGVAPPSSLLEKSHAHRADSDDEEMPAAEYILDPTTGGRIYIKDAAGVIYKYVAAHSEKRSSKPLFEHNTVDGGLFQCSVILPKHTPLSNVTGSPARSKNEARRVACYQTCQRLYELGFLDHTLFPHPPTIRSFLPDIYADFKAEPDWEARGKGPKVPNPLANATLDATGQVIKGKTAGTRCYARKRPAFWKNSLLMGFSGKLYPTILDYDVSEITNENHRPLCILARHPLPPIEPFRIFHSGFSVEVSLRRCEPVELNEEKLNELHQYTVRLCRAISNKALENVLEKTPYFLAPMRPGWASPSFSKSSSSINYWRLSAGDDIAWDEVVVGARHWFRPLRRSSLEELEVDLQDAIIQDRKQEFARKFDAIRLRRDLSPQSKPEGLNKDMPFESYIELCKVRRKDFEGLEDENQPMIEASAAGELLNRLSPTLNSSNTGRPTNPQYLIPELTVRNTIMSSVYRSALLFPSIIRRVDEYLLVKEVNAKLFDNWLQERAVLVALTAPSACVEFDYERQELLGDAYLKYLSSIYLFVTYPTQQEGAMHVARQRIISNRSLLQRARESDVPQYIQSKPFTPKLWIPYNYKFAKRVRELSLTEVPSTEASASKETLLGSHKRSGDELMESSEFVESEINDHRGEHPTSNEHGPSQEGSEFQRNNDASSHTASSKPRRQWEDTRVQWLGDKCVADVAEALIGAAVITGGIESALKISKDLGCYLPRVDRWSDFGRKVLAPPPELTAELSSESLAAIEELVGFTISKPYIMAQALTHTSIQGSDVPCYERLEFLGDAVLDYLVVGHIFDLYGSLSPGALTLLKGAMVTNFALAAVCVEMGLYKYMIFESTTLGTEIEEYVVQLERARDLEYKIADNEGRPPGQYWVDIEPPKPLSDIVESILGAILVLDNFSSKGTDQIYNKVLKPFFEKHISLQTLAHHPTKVLFEMFQARGCQQFEIAEGLVNGRDAEGQPLPKGHVRCDVICHDVILASAVDSTLPLASRRSCYMALDALGGDPDFLDNTCNCRTVMQAQREHRHDRPQIRPDGVSVKSAPGSASSDDIDLNDGEEGEVQDVVDEQYDGEDTEMDGGDEGAGRPSHSMMD